jgi:hypothetical protein
MASKFWNLIFQAGRLSRYPVFCCRIILRESVDCIDNDNVLLEKGGGLQGAFYGVGVEEPAEASIYPVESNKNRSGNGLFNMLRIIYFIRSQIPEIRSRKPANPSIMSPAPTWT